MNKKGERIFSVWWVLSIVFISVVFAGAVYMIYSTDVNIRDEESKILYERIYDCIIENGYVSEDFLKNDFDIFSVCKLNKNLFSEGLFAFSISLYDENDNLVQDKFTTGFSDISERCVYSRSSKNSPTCFDKKSLVFYFDSNKIRKGYLEILTVSNNFEKGGSR